MLVLLETRLLVLSKSCFAPYFAEFTPPTAQSFHCIPLFFFFLPLGGTKSGISSTYYFSPSSWVSANSDVQQNSNPANTECKVVLCAVFCNIHEFFKPPWEVGSYLYLCLTSEVIISKATKQIVNRARNTTSTTVRYNVKSLPCGNIQVWIWTWFVSLLISRTWTSYSTSLSLSFLPIKRNILYLVMTYVDSK